VKWFNKLVDWFGDLVGDTEDVIHHPIYPIEDYTAVVDAKLSRGSWPDRDKILRLKAEGYTLIINLCKERHETDPNVPCANFDIEDNGLPTQLQIHAFISLVQKTTRSYVHCEAGKGRTGVMVAAYRIKVNRWAAENALREAEGYGLAMPNQKEFILSLSKEN
jgi:atypical dual specificity phosphatase